MNEERLDKIKENVYTRCNIANFSGIGMTASDKEELELLEEIERLNNRVKQLEKSIMISNKKHSFMTKDNIKLRTIINELEKMMKNDLECSCSMNENGLFNGAIDILEVYLDKLQELKGSDK